MHWQRELEQLCADRKSGAAILTRKAARLLERMVKSAVDPPTLIAAAERLSDAHPAMAPLWHLTQLVRQHTATPSQIAPALRQFVADMDAHIQAAIARAVEWLPEGTVLTHSFSSLVFQALVRACRQGKRLRIVCTASHPGGEGIILAKALAKEGVAVTLVADLQAFAWLPHCSVLLVGADALCVDGLVHKVGTRPLAMAAKQNGVSLWSVATSEKRLPLPWQERMKGEALPVAKIGVAQDRTLYDLTEWELVAGVITEEGVKIVGGSAYPSSERGAGHAQTNSEGERQKGASYRPSHPATIVGVNQAAGLALPADGKGKEAMGEGIKASRRRVPHGIGYFAENRPRD